MSDDRPIFVLGCPRSGTTLIQLMLSAHPRIAIPPETRFVIPAYRRRREWGDLGKAENRRALASWLVDSDGTWFADLGLPAEEITAAIVDGPPTLGSAIGTVLRAYAHKFGKPRWGDKYPPYHQDVPALLRMFPDAQFIHIVRDGRDCVASLKRMPWFRGDVLRAAHTWAYAIDAGRHWSRRLGAGSWHEVIYERLVRDPRAELGALCTFLGEGFAEEMCAPHLLAPLMVPQRKSWHTGLRRELNAGKIGAFSAGLDTQEIGLMEAVNARRLRHYGYVLSGHGQSPALELRAGYAAVALRRRTAIRRRHMLDALDLRRHPTPLAAQ